MEFKTLKSEITYRARVFDVQRDEVRYPSGHKTTYEIVVHNGAVAMVPVDADGGILFVRQYRHTTGKRILEIPAGTLNKGEDPEACAQRELREEIGMAPGRLTRLAEFYLAPGYSTERMHVYLAQDLRPEHLPHDEDEDLDVEKLSMGEAFAAIRNGEIEEAKTMLGLYLAKEFLESRG
ncbi:MAG: NUDIX hydrolase [Anaerolineales bacterium]